MLPPEVPQILVNRESLKHMNFDVELLGDCDGIVNELLLRLEEKRKQNQPTKECPSWSNICMKEEMLTQISDHEAERQFFSKKMSDELNIMSSSSLIDMKKATELEKQCDNEAQKSNILCKKYSKDFLNENTFLYLKPNIYVFHGAEISIRNVKKKIKRLRKKLNIKDELVSSESDENVGINSNKKDSKHSYLSEIYKNQQNRIEESDNDDEFSDEFSTDETDSDSEDSESSSDTDEELENNTKILIEESSDDENDEDFSLERNLKKNNLADFLSENIQKALKNKDT